ncbi:MAG: hypothetical protein WDM81_14425 [Rhizomicrobium sp.]
MSMFQRGSSGAARLFEILDHEPEIRDAPEARPLDRIGGDIKLQHFPIPIRDAKRRHAAPTPKRRPPGRPP